MTNGGTVSKVVIVISALAMIVAVVAAAFCIVDHERYDDYNDVKYTLYIGLGTGTNDGVVEADVKDYLTDRGQGYTFFEAEGGYKSGSTYMTEASLVFILNDCRGSLVDDLVDYLTERLDLTVMVEKQIVDAELEFDD